MPKVSAKRQITLPVVQCQLAGIEPGDECESYVDSDGHITIVKKVAGAAAGLLRHVVADPLVSDEESLAGSLGG